MALLRMCPCCVSVDLDRLYIVLVDRKLRLKRLLRLIIPCSVYVL
jgi:hypothetical protein